MRTLVAERLAAHPGEHDLHNTHGPLPLRAPDFDAYRDAVVADMTRRLAARQHSLRTPPDPRLITIKSWQFGFTDAPDDDAATRSFHDGVFLALQGYRAGYRSSQAWQACLDAMDHPARWLELGRAREDEGWLVDANACFAAARWQDPALAPAVAAVVAARDPRLPRRLLAQPVADFPDLRFADRHWRAWDMKNYGRLDLPSLLRWECDRNFSVRARIYRSLGQQPHPAAIPTLHEGTRDPHPFARAQAVRSLGWCADPTGVDHLRGLAVGDPHPEVRRVAAKAVQRIVGYWTFFGAWPAITASAEHALAAARRLVELGLPIFAHELLVRYTDAGTGDHPEVDELCEHLEAALPPAGFTDDESRYNHWFAEARAVELAGDPVTTPAEAEAAAADPGPRGFEARRILRKLDLGAPDQRRLRVLDPLA